MKIKKNRTEILNLTSALNRVNGLKGFKVGYAITKTADMMQSYVKDIAIAEKQLKDYYEERALIVDKYARKDSTGQKVLLPGSKEPIIDDQNAFLKEVKVLEKKNKKSLDAYEEYMKEDIDVEVHGVDAEEVDDEISIEHLRALQPLIKPEE